MPSSSFGGQYRENRLPARHPGSAPRDGTGCRHWQRRQRYLGCPRERAHFWLCHGSGYDASRSSGRGQKLGRPWEVGKAFDESAPIGPIHRSSGGAAWASGAISLEVNGATRQSSDISKLIWNIGEIIEHLSALWALAAGDLIYTGTPEGVAAVVKGDLMVGRIAQLGELRVEVI